MDTPELYDADVMDFNLKYYGALALYIDQTPALYLDFTEQYDRVMGCIDDEIMTAGWCGRSGAQGCVRGVQ